MVVFVIVLFLIFVLPIFLVSAYEAYRKRRFAFFSTSLGVLGIVLVLLGSMVMVPYTEIQTFNNRPHDYTVWTDDSFTLQPHTDKSYGINEDNQDNYPIVPEFPTWTSILLTLMVLTVTTAIYKRRLVKTPVH